MVRPEESGLPNLIRRTLNKDVRVKVEKGIFRVGRVNGDGGPDVAVDDNENLNAFLGFSLKKSI